MKNITVLTVSQLTYYIKSLFESDENLKTVFMVGEVSNFVNHYKSGHMYFSLKDENSSIKAIMFSYAAKNVRFNIENGMKVLVRGRVDIYEASGQYQIYVDDIKPEGAGELNLAFEQLKLKLSEEGLFDQEKKKKIPSMPTKIGVVTSKSGAAIRDIENVLGRRYPLAEIVFCPVQVQGDEAPGQIENAIRFFNKKKACDVLIVGRGGGSIEDLWAFNTEEVARAVYESEIPIISAVGHETDFTICDFVADLRAPTPSAAAELASPDINELIDEIKYLEDRLKRSALLKINKEKLLLDSFVSNLTSPKQRLEEEKLKLDLRYNKLRELFEKKLSSKREKYIELVSGLNALNPLDVLSRGYAVAFTQDGKPIDSIDKAEDKIILRLNDGRLYLTLDRKEHINIEK